MNRVHMNVSEIINSQTKTSLENSLEKIEGVQMINIDMARGTVEVGFNAPANDIAIRNCIENTGFRILA